MSPYASHLFICTNRRTTGESCAARDSEALRDTVKAQVKATLGPDAKDRVRVNASGCLGYCERGIVAVAYPRGEWFLDQKADDPQCVARLVKAALRER